MKSFLFIFVLTVTHLGFGQDQMPRTFLPEKVDSIHFSALINVTKEMVYSEVEPYYENLGTVSLTEPEMSGLIKKVKKKSAFGRGRALLTHHNLVFDFYTKGKLVLEIHISTLTRNIDAYPANNPEGFYGKISQKMGRFLIKLIRQYGFYKTLYDRGDLEGLNHPNL